MDVGRSPYTVRARLYPDSDAQFNLVWYECRPDAPVLPYPTAINSLYQEGDRDDWWPTAVGEILGTAATYHETHQKQFALGTHQCGTAEDFAGDGAIDLVSPPVEYRADGLPKCCGDVRFEPALGGVQFFNWDTGGVQFGGSCPADVYTLTSARGGVEVGGAPGLVAYLPYPSAGGVEAGGAPGLVAYLPYPSAGGVEVGGACGAVVYVLGSALGGVEVGGEFGVVQHVAAPTAGGQQLGGAAGFAPRLPVPAAGGQQLGGAPGLLAFLPVPAAGGQQLGGAAGRVIRPTGGAAGGQQLGGAAGVVFTPPTPTPGANCAGAPTVTQGTTYGYTISAGMGVEQWFKFTIPSTGNWHIATTGVVIMSVSLQVYKNGSCPLPNLLSGWTFGPPRWSGAATSGDVFWLKFTPPPMGSAPYTFVWDSGL